MAEPYDSVRKKVAAIFSEMARERAKTLESPVSAKSVQTVITAALSATDLGDPGEPQILHAPTVAFHLTDWNSDAAFLVALHLFPERFTQEEIRAGIDLFLVHVPHHVIAAARLTGNSTEDIFVDVDKKSAASLRQRRIRPK